MAILPTTSRLSKDLTLFGVYAIATGTTLSAGLFLLPGLAAREAGPAVVLCYMLAAIPLIPAMLSIVELATAMPRAGGAYYFLDRSLGPLAGTIGGMGTWLALVLKSGFALVGIGAYIHLFFPDAPTKLIATGFAIFFGVVNWTGSKKTGRAQIYLVIGLLAILALFTAFGVPRVDGSHFRDFFGKGAASILSTTGLVYISYVGVTKIASVAEEVRNPERNLPLGVFLALATAMIVYCICTAIMVGVIPMDVLTGADESMRYLTPMAEASERIADSAGIGGLIGKALISIAALLAFASVANAGILSSSRYPLAMGRDHLLPTVFRHLNRWNTPTLSIIVTVAVIILFIQLKPVQIAKLASAFQLLMFALLCLAVIVMRESRIESYDPGYRSPFYPWMQLVGIIAPVVLIVEMGWLPMVFCLGLMVVGVAWFYAYAGRRVVRHGAIYHVFERLGRHRFDDLDRELRGILKEKGLRARDPFVETVAEADVIDAPEHQRFEQLVGEAAAVIAQRTTYTADSLARGFLEGTRTGATPVSGSVALPHLRLPDLPRPMLVIARSQTGIELDVGDVFGGSGSSETTHAIFFLVSPEADPGRHLRLLAELASRADQEGFLTEWLAVGDPHRLKEPLLRHERYLSIVLEPGTPTEALIGKPVRDLGLPPGSLIPLVRRARETIVPGGGTVLREGDRVTIIGDADAIETLKREYGVTPIEPVDSEEGER